MSTKESLKYILYEVILTCLISVKNLEQLSCRVDVWSSNATKPNLYIVPRTRSLVLARASTFADVGDSSRWKRLRIFSLFSPFSISGSL